MKDNKDKWKEIFEKMEPYFKHLEYIKKMQPFGAEEDCRHKSCPSCQGTGIKTCGAPCIHMLYCSCKRCSIT